MPPKGSKKITTTTNRGITSGSSTTTRTTASSSIAASSTTLSSTFVPQEEYATIVPTLCALGETLDRKAMAVEREIHELEQMEKQLLEDRALLKEKIAAMEE